jgi:LacI family transcriptional regulator
VAVRDDPKLLETYSHLLADRGVEGLITVDTQIDRPLLLPAIAIPGHHHVEGVTNIVLDHRKAAWLALNHLFELGHKEIAFVKGPDESPDAKDRWKGIRRVVKELGIPMPAELIVQLESRDTTPRLGYPIARQLLSRARPFTALFAYNDVAAIGVIHALVAPQLSGGRIPFQNLIRGACPSICE